MECHYQAYFAANGMDPSGNDFIAISDRLVKAEPLKFTVIGIEHTFTPKTIFFHYSLEYWTCPCGYGYESITAGVLISRKDAISTNCTLAETAELVVDFRWKAAAKIAETLDVDIPIGVSSVHYPEDLPKNLRLIPSFVSGPNAVGQKWNDVIAKAKAYPWAEQKGGGIKNWTSSLYNPFQTNSNTFAYQVLTGAGLTWFDLPGMHPGTKRKPSQNKYPLIEFDGAKLPVLK